MDDETKKHNTSIKAIANDLGLSPGTVSIVLNRRGDEMRISRSTQQRVLEYAKNVNYQPNIYAKRLRKSKKNTSNPIIVVFWPTNFNPNLLSRFFSGVNTFSENSPIGLEIMIQPYRTDEISKFVDHVSRNYYSGAIIMGLSEKDVGFMLDQKFDIPIVLFNRVSNNYSAVCVDDFESGTMAADLFYKRGHKHAAIIGYGLISRSTALKRSGFLCTVAEKGITLEIDDIIDSELSYQGGATAVDQLVARYPDYSKLPTAIFIQDGIMAIGAIAAFQRHGIQIPDDIEILSYGDNPQEAFTTPSLTSIHMPVEEMSYDCIRILLDLIQQGSFHHYTTMHPTSFIFRESCGDANSVYISRKP